MAAMAAIDDILALQDDTAFAIALGEHVFERFEAVGFAGLRPAEQVAHCVHWLELEVNNGGFDQFFWNSAGDQAQQTVDALEAIGAPKFADLVRRAIAVFPGGTPSPDRDERGDAMAGKNKDGALWYDHDGEFCEYPENLAQLMRRYVAAHRGEFE